jgi:rhodanese-related sulfurtransferase
MMIMKSLSAIELKEKLASGEELLLIDVREPFEYEICHLTGAQLIPLGSIPTNLKSIDSSKTVIVYCHHGVRSAHAINYLKQATGTDNFYNLEGGIDAWSVEADPSTPRY